MEFLKNFFQKEMTKRIGVLLFLAIFFYVTRTLFNLFLLTFLFSYLIYSIQSFITRKVLRGIKIPQIIITLILYCLVVISIVLFIYRYIPIIVRQSNVIINEIKEFDINSGDTVFSQYLGSITQQVDLKGYAKDGMSLLFQSATSIGKWSLNIFLAIILSMFFMIERPRVKQFMSKFQNSRIASFYKYLQFFGNNFLNSFGKVMQAQILIAITNCLLSVIALRIMHFPQLLALGLMIFLLSLIPVAGVVISLIPLSIIAFQIGGWIKVVYIIILVVVLHGLESYLLNPKFMSDKTKLPVFFTFIVLIVSEHFMGIWGLMIGIPLFMFFLDIINVKVDE